jgi:hypothetical protein
MLGMPVTFRMVGMESSRYSMVCETWERGYKSIVNLFRDIT